MVKMLSVKLESVGESFAQWHLRLPAQLALDLGDVGPRAVGFAGALREVDFFAAQQFDEAVDRLRIAQEVGSDLPLFLIGGTVLGIGRGEQVFPLPEMPTLNIVVVTPDFGVSTPKAFAAWDGLFSNGNGPTLTVSGQTSTLNRFSSEVYSWLNGTSFSAPQVSGAIALMLEANPSLTPAQVKDILQRIRGNADAGVAYTGYHVGALPVDGERNGSALIGVLGTV